MDPSFTMSPVLETPPATFFAAETGGEKLAGMAIRIRGCNVRKSDGAGPARVRSRRFPGTAGQSTRAVEGSQTPVMARMRADIISEGLREATLSVNERDTLVFEKAATSD